MAELFGCSPLWFEFAVNFSQNCNNTNLTANPGLLDQGCVELGLRDNNLTNLAPVAITSIRIEEFAFNDFLQDESIPGSVLDGDIFNYTSALSSNRTVPPYGFQMIINGFNNASEEIYQYFFIIYSNENYEPVLKPGDGIGWLRIIDTVPPESDTCPAVVPQEPSVSMAPSSFVCNICAEPGSAVTLPEVMPGVIENATCSDLDILGKEGMLTPEFCDLAIAAATMDCGCEVPSEAPTAALTSSPTRPPSFLPPAVISTRCSICERSSSILTLPDAIAIPSLNLTCFEVNALGEQGFLETNLCEVLPRLLFNQCGCQSVPTPQPSTHPPFESPSSLSLIPSQVPDVPPSLSPGASTPPPTPTSPNFFFCVLCESGFTRPGVMPLPGEETTCEEFEAASEILDDPVSCAEVSAFLADPCGCETPQPTSSPTDEPTMPCSICGEGGVVGFPDALAFPALDSELTCGDVNALAELGVLTESFCLHIFQTLFVPCGCRTGATPRPTPSPITPRPTRPPTPRPTRTPTPRPTPRPTSPLPTLAPTLTSSPSFVAPVTNNLDSIGQDFIVSFLMNFIDRNVDAIFNMELHLATTSNTTVHATVEYPVGIFLTNVTMLADNVTVVSLPLDVAFAWIEGFGPQSNSVRVFSEEAEFTVYVVNRATSTSDAALALPIEALNNKYILVDYSSRFTDSPPEFVVTAVQNRTRVTITPTATLVERPANVPFTITLNRGDSYYGTAVVASVGTTTLTGTVIETTKPVSVTIGVRCGNVFPTTSSCDHIFEVAHPVQTWGNTSVATGLPERPGGSVYRVVAAEDNTTVSIVAESRSMDVLLDGSDYHDTVETIGGVVVEADGPIFVVQYMTGQQRPGAGRGDPSMVNIIPTDQYLKRYLFATIGDEQFDTHYVSVIVHNVDVGSFFLDELTIGNSSFTEIGDSGFSSAQIRLSEGVHTTQSLHGGHTISVIGTSRSGSYVYPGGAGFDVIDQPSAALALSYRKGHGQRLDMFDDSTEP